MRDRTSVLLLLAFTTSSVALGGELKGRVFQRDGKPAPSLTVEAVPYETPHEAALREAGRGAEPAPLATASTAADGRFTVSVARPDARFTLRVHGRGVVGVALDGVWEAGEVEEIPEITVLKSEPLAGKVVDGRGAPVAGAEVTLSPGAGRGSNDVGRLPLHATTGADGTFRFEGAASEANVLSAEKEGFAPTRVEGLRSGAVARPVVLRPGVPFSGSVLAPDRKTPAKGALVRFEGTAATRWIAAGEDGRFSIAHAPEGKGALTVDAGDAGYAEVASLSLPLRGGKPFVVTLAPTAALEGRVVDAKTSRAVPRAKLVARGAAGARVVRSGPDGRYRIAPLASGSVQLRVDEPRYVLWKKDAIPLGRGETKTLDIALTLGATLAGRVVDENGQPVADAKGALERGGQNALEALMRRASSAAAFRTSVDGSFRATRLAPGDGQKLTVTHVELESATAAGLALPPGGVKADVRVVMRRGAAITGVVHDKNAAPISGAEVTLQRETGLRGGRRGAMAMVNILGSGGRTPVTTGADGRFRIAGVAPGDWTVDVRKQGWAREQVSPVKVSEERTAAPLDVTLTPGSAIAGIMKSKGGTPLAGYMVSARVPGSSMFGGGLNLPEPTGPDGTFFLDGLKAGQSYDLTAFGGGGFMPSQKPGVVAPAQGVEFVVTGNGRITGRAVDEKSGRPLTDFTVATEPDMMGGRVIRMAVRSAGRAGGGMSQSTAVHDEEGVFAMDDVPAGTWSVVVDAKGYQSARVGGVTVEEGATKDNVEVRVSPGGSLKGRVLDGRSGRGVPEVSVSAGPVSGGGPSLVTLGIDDGSGASTDAEGRFELEGLAPGRYKVTARHADYAEASETAEVKESGGSVDLRLSAGGSLGGTVLSESRQPVAAAEVSLSEEGEGGFGPRGMGLGGTTATTDASGRFRFEHLNAGRFSLTAALRSKSSAPASAVLSAGESKEDVVLTLAAGTTIRGVVSGLPDDRRAGVNVSGSGPEGWGASSRTGADGRFELPDAPAGAIMLRAQAGDFLGSTRTASKQVVVDESQPVVETEIVFEPGFTLSGRVTKAGKPVEGSSVNVSQIGGGPGGSARTDDSGNYSVEGLQKGRYNVFVFGGGPGASSKSQSVEIAGDQTLDIDFPNARIDGTVVEAGSKRPLADVEVEVTAASGAPDGPIIRRGSRTDSNGRFSAEDLEPKTYSLTAQKTDFLFEKRDVAATEQGADGLVIELTRGEGIGIEVVDGIYRIPLKGVFVRVNDSGNRAIFSSPVSLDSQGRGEIPSLKPGGYSVWMDADGYAPVTVDSVTVPSSTLAVAMTPGGTVEVHAGPKTLAGGSAKLLFLTASGRPYQMGPWSSEGTITISVPIRRIENFAPGSYSVTGGASGPQSFQVQEGQTTIVTLP